ncbi:MAG: hypothetical protein NTX25_22990, partial [Proteobacteria bacterium]|nr:hypothetical protein [Pseudomonadota bacterium]
SRIQEIALGAKSFDEIWALISEEKLDTADQDAYLKLKAWIYLHPDEMKTLKEHLQTLADTDLALRLSIRALAAAGHPAAQDVLLGLLQERQANIPLARKLLSTLGFIEEPSPAAQKVLEHLSQSAKDPSLQRSSRLALGIMGQHLKQSPQIDSQERADTILDHAMQRLRAAHTETEITDELASIGNAGPKHVAALKPWLGDSNPKIRGQAYFALRFAEPSETSLFLGSSYLTETLPAVRSQIVQALTLRKIDDEWFQAIQNLVSAGPAANDQLAIAKSLMRGMAINRTKTLDIFQKLQEKTQDGELKRALSSFQAVAEGHNPIL